MAPRTLSGVAPDIATMQVTHDLALSLGAPDLASDPLSRDRKSGTATEAAIPRTDLLARASLLRQRALLSLDRRPVAHYPREFVRCGHEKSPENTYLDPKGPRCRECRNAKRRAARASAMEPSSPIAA